MADIKLKNWNGSDQTYSGVSKITLPTPTGTMEISLGNKVEYTRKFTSDTTGDVYFSSLDADEKATMLAHRSDSTAKVTVHLETTKTNSKFVNIMAQNSSIAGGGSVYQIGLIYNSSTVVVGTHNLTWGLDGNSSYAYIDSTGNLKLYTTKFGGIKAGTYKITFEW